MGRTVAVIGERRASLRSAQSPALMAAAEQPPPESMAKRSNGEEAEVPAKKKRPTPAKAGDSKKAAGSPAKPAAKKASGSPKVPVAHASRAREEAAWALHQFVVGCDEAGRGPLAGPVVAAACALPANLPPIPGVGDPKTITDEAERERLYEEIIAAPGVAWSARVVSASRIDEINILMASLEAMRLSIVDVLSEATPSDALALIDGPFSPWKEGAKYVDFQLPAPPPSVSLSVEPIKGGDAKVYCIAAASIIAKVTRDRIMHTLAEEWPMYGFEQHKGYPTAKHVHAISKHGACAAHRRSFAPLKAQNLPPPTAEQDAHIEKLCSLKSK